MPRPHRGIPPLAGLLAIACLWAATGCESVSGRIKERPQAYARLAPMEQQRVKRGEIKVGDSFDIVYLALGSPSEHESITLSDGSIRTIWSYYKLRQRSGGVQTIGYETQTEYDINSGSYIVHNEPIRDEVYTPDRTRHLQVIFRHDVVVSTQFARQVEAREASPATP